MSELFDIGIQYPGVIYTHIKSDMKGYENSRTLMRWNDEDNKLVLWPSLNESTDFL